MYSKQIEQSFGLALSTHVWSTRASTGCPKKLAVFDNWNVVSLTVVAKLSSIAAGFAQNVDASKNQRVEIRA